MFGRIEEVIAALNDEYVEIKIEENDKIYTMTKNSLLLIQSK